MGFEGQVKVHGTAPREHGCTYKEQISLLDLNE